MIHGTEDAVVAAKQSMRLQTARAASVSMPNSNRSSAAGTGKASRTRARPLAPLAIDRFTEAANGQSACGSDINGNGIVDSPT